MLLKPLTKTGPEPTLLWGPSMAVEGTTGAVCQGQRQQVTSWAKLLADRQPWVHRCHQCNSVTVSNPRRNPSGTRVQGGLLSASAQKGRATQCLLLKASSHFLPSESCYCGVETDGRWGAGGSHNKSDVPVSERLWSSDDLGKKEILKK